MGSESKPWLIWWAVAASAAVHAGAAAGVAAFPTALPFGEASITSEVDFVLLELPEEETPEPLPEPSPTLEEPSTEPRLATVIRDTSVEETLPNIELPTTHEEPEPRREEEDEPREQQRPMVNLDPASVAAAAVVYDDSPPAPRTRAGGTDDRGTEEALEAQHNGALSAAANARPHVSRRPPPRLRARSDGTYVFHGHVFDAVIARDGTVRFSDRGGIEMDAPSATRPNGLVPSGTFDISDSIESARGNDPYRHERHWFMEQTRELRERLADRADAHDQRRGMARLRGDLRRIWRGRGTDRQRRARIFQMWDDCAEDEVGRRARAAIIAFVRESLPQGSPGAFTAGELGALNRERLSREPFAPY
jgi:hypothetical protein